MGEHGCKSFIFKSDRNLRKDFLESVEKSANIFRRFGRLAVHIDGVADHEAFYGLFFRVFLKIFYYLCRRNRLKRRREYAQRVAHRDANAFTPIVDANYSVHTAKVTFYMAKSARKQKTPASKLRVELTEDQSERKIWSYKATKSNLIVFVVAGVLLIMAVTYCLTAFTGLRHTVPGYPSAETRNTALANAAKIDSLEQVIDGWVFQLANIQRVVTGKEPLALDSVFVASDTTSLEPEIKAAYALSDSLLREQVKKEEQFDSNRKRSGNAQIEGLHFYPPVRGLITQAFNPAIGHPFVDVAAAALTPVCATLDGTVIASYWNDLTGYTLTIQHDNNIISVYKHNEKLLKKVGDKVTAGMPVAIIGDTGELSTGIHLHFELWHKGEAVDPTLYITF